MAEAVATETSLGRLKRLALVAAFATTVALAGLFALPPLDRDEARFAQATAQMLESGDFINIRFQDAERNRKPAGIYWLQAASVAAFSSPEARAIWAYRLPSAAGAVIAALFTYLAGARLYEPKTGLLGAFLLASAPLFAAEATIAKTDAVLLATVAAAEAAFIHVFAAWREGRRGGWAWPLVFWIAIGAGVLVKGPITPMVAGLTAVAMFVRTPNFAWVRALRPATGILLVALIVGPWAIAIGEATEGRFFTQAIGRDMLGKIGEAQESHGAPPGYHLLLVSILFWPAAALIAPGLARAIRTRASWPSWLLLGWLVPGWLVFEFTATKLPHYPLPLYPALAILAARAAATGEAARRRVWRRLGAAGYAATGVGVGAAVAALPMFLGDGTLDPHCAAAAVLIALAAILIAILFWRGRAFAGGFAAAGLGALVAWTLLNGVLPSLKQLALSPSLSAALDERGLHPIHDGAPPVAIAGYSEPSAVFLLGTGTELTGGAGAARHLIRYPGSAVIVEAREADDFHTFLFHAQATAREVARVEGLNYSNGRRVRLVIFVAGPSS